MEQRTIETSKEGFVERVESLVKSNALVEAGVLALAAAGAIALHKPKLFTEAEKILPHATELLPKAFDPLIDVVHSTYADGESFTRISSARAAEAERIAALPESARKKAIANVAVDLPTLPSRVGGEITHEFDKPIFVSGFERFGLVKKLILKKDLIGAINENGMAGNTISERIPELKQAPDSIWQSVDYGTNGHCSIFFDRPANFPLTIQQRSSDFGHTWGLEQPVTRQATVEKIGINPSKKNSGIEFRGWKYEPVFDPKEHPVTLDGRKLAFYTIETNSAGRVNFFQTVDNLVGRPRWRMFQS